MSQDQFADTTSQKNLYQILKGTSWLPTVMALHNQIREDLPENKRHGFLPRGEEYFLALLEGRGGALWGVFDEASNLAGVCAVLLKANLSVAQRSGSITCPDDGGHFSRLCGEDTLAVIQSLGVAKSANGKRLAQGLIQDACLWAYSQNCAHVFAQIAQDNKCSWNQFVKQGFGIVCSWTAEHPRYLLYRGLIPYALLADNAFIGAPVEG